MDCYVTCRQFFTVDQRFDNTVHHKKRHSRSDQSCEHRYQSRIGILNVTAHIGLDLFKHCFHRLSLTL